MPYGLSIDIDAVKCVDMGHCWIRCSTDEHRPAS